jgi:hypothetical protein
LDLSWLAGRQVFEPQFLLSEQGALFLVWREESEPGSDLYIARRGEESRFGEPVRVNDEAGTVESYAHDEMRAAVAVGPAGRVGVAWADSRGQVRAAISMEGGTSFAPSIRLEQSAASAYRGFPAVAFDDAGVLHAVWIDSRFAAAGAEEPADLYYARVEDGVATESNLTAEQEPTVCGCCRTYLEVTDQGVTRALFRNASQDGYRDIFTVSAAAGADMSPPARIGQPLWKLQGCPMSGPIAAAGRVLWPDGSSGRKLLMEAGVFRGAARRLVAAAVPATGVVERGASSPAAARATRLAADLAGRKRRRLEDPRRRPAGVGHQRAEREWLFASYRSGERRVQERTPSAGTLNGRWHQEAVGETRVPPRCAASRWIVSRWPRVALTRRRSFALRLELHLGSGVLAGRRRGTTAR